MSPSARAAAQEEPPPEPTATAEATATETTTGPSAPLVIVPAGCVAPPAAQALFIATLVDSVPNTARFRVDQLRAGSLDGFVVAGQVDVDYDDETRFLDRDETYLVGAAVDPDTGRLFSKVREPAPLFGGNDVVGIHDTDVECPEVDDPIRTVFPDGSSVETGVFSPLTKSTARLARAIALPAAVAFAIVFALAALKTAIVGIGHGYGALARRALGEPVAGRRRHSSR